MKKLFLASAAAAVLAACGAQEAAQTATTIDSNSDVAAAGERVVETTSRDDWGEFGLDLYSMDTSVQPGRQFLPLYERHLV